MPTYDILNHEALSPILDQNSFMKDKFIISIYSNTIIIMSQKKPIIRNN